MTVPGSSRSSAWATAGDSGTNRFEWNNVHVELAGGADTALFDTSTSSGHYNLLFSNSSILAYGDEDAVSLVGPATTVTYEHSTIRSHGSDTCTVIDTSHTCGHVQKFTATSRSSGSRS